MISSLSNHICRRQLSKLVQLLLILGVHLSLSMNNEYANLVKNERKLILAYRLSC